jgi:hypothetical protein
MPIGDHWWWRWRHDVSCVIIYAQVLGNATSEMRSLIFILFCVH